MISIYPVDDVFVRLECDDSIAKELSEYFAFDVPGARFMQNKFGKQWNGKIKLFNLGNHRIYRGLVSRICEFADARQYEVVDHCPPPEPIDYQLEHLKLPFDRQPRDYQIAALHYALDNARCIIQSPTGSGKSLIIYLITQILNLKTLIVVPTLGLVSQMQSDFKDYGFAEPMSVIKGGTSKDAVARVTVSTWQSIYELDKDYYEQFECVIVDEVHTAKAKSLTDLLKKCTLTPYRIGLTGTLDNTECHRLVLEGLFGPVFQTTTTAKLQKEKRLAKLRVRMIALAYPNDVCMAVKRLPYIEEIDYITQHPARNEFIARLVTQCDGNTLVLFQFVQKHGLALFQRITELAKASGKQVHYIAGSVSAEDRERIRKEVESGDNHIVVASYGTFQLGVNVPKLKNLVFAHPAKSPIRVLQSVGRILRLTEGKTDARLYDIADDLRSGKYTNHLFKHAEARTQYYSTEKFPMTMQQVSLETFVGMLRQTAQEPLGATNDD